MRICALQLDVVFGDRAANKEKVRCRLEEAMRGKPDVIVLPELWDLGFYPDNARELGDVDGEDARAFLGSLAANHAVNIVGGSIVRLSGGKLWNTCYVFDRTGKEIAVYDKTHLFSPSGEHNNFEPGGHLTGFQLDGVPASVIICYDIRFGELVRMQALAGAQIVFAPAAWPHPRLNHWRLLSQVRAIENQLFMVSVNNCGIAGSMHFCGHSMMVDPWGEIIAEAGDEEQVLYGVCDFTILKDIRQRINVFRDRRPGLYHWPH